MNKGPRGESSHLPPAPAPAPHHSGEDRLSAGGQPHHRWGSLLAWPYFGRCRENNLEGDSFSRFLGEVAIPPAPGAPEIKLLAIGEGWGQGWALRAQSTRTPWAAANEGNSCSGTVRKVQQHQNAAEGGHVPRSGMRWDQSQQKNLFFLSLPPSLFHFLPPSLTSSLHILSLLPQCNLPWSLHLLDIPSPPTVHFPHPCPAWHLSLWHIPCTSLLCLLLSPPTPIISMGTGIYLLAPRI